METNDIITLLEDTLHLIERAHINFKKVPKTQLTLGYVKVRSQCIQEYWVKFKELHSLLLRTIKKEELMVVPYFLNDVYGTCEDKYLTVRTEMEEIMSSLMEDTFHIASTVNSTSSSALKMGEVKLPKIDLPKFNGEYEQWLTFEDAFISLIHKNSNLTNFHKLHYLKSCVTGEAATSLKCYKVTESNYAPAWETLKERYCHKRLIVNTIFKRLLGQEKICTQSASQLKGLIDGIKEVITGLKNVGISTVSWDPILIFIVTERLDIDTHREWEDHVSKEYNKELPTFISLLDFLEKKVFTLELISSSKFNKESKNAFYLSTKEKERKESNCTYCKEIHKLYQCETFKRLNVKQRKIFVTNTGLCFRCLSPGHRAYMCQNRLHCEYCGKRHSKLLHDFNNYNRISVRNKYVLNSGTSRENDSIYDPTRSIEGKKCNDERDEITNATFKSQGSNKKSNCNLLATALVPVKDKHGQTYFMRALVDQGSQVTCISQRAAQLLKLKQYPAKESIVGLGNKETEVNHTVQLELLSRYEKGFNLRMNAFVTTEQVITYLPEQPIDKLPWPHVVGLPLADPNFNRPDKIDLLLGVDVCAQILQNDMLKGPAGTPCAQKTSLGWILFGNVFSVL